MLECSLLVCARRIRLRHEAQNGIVARNSSRFFAETYFRMKASLIEMRICEGLLVSLGLAACIGGLAFTVPQLTEATYARVKVRVEK